ncbi:MAG: winged helix-turn-helix domain-containing protein [Alphaproteobacteria bacterium]|nr:winged helix-turn-helix domain-containing protein [Alphaproteobacteria bacterium]
MHGGRKPARTRASLSKDEARRISIAAQGFAPRAKSPPGRKRLLATIRQIGLLQLDSVNVLIRSHYLPLFSRLGPYSTKVLDDLGRGRGRALFEYWGHEASLIPLDYYPLFRWRMQEAKKWEGMTRLAREKPEYIAAVLKQVSERGPLRTSDLSEGGKSLGGWWGWGEGKRALEYLFLSGQIAAAERRGFERIYDVALRVIPKHALERPAVGVADAHRQLLELAARAYGVATEMDLRDYFRLPVAETKLRLAELVESRILEPVSVEGWKHQAYLHAKAKAPRSLSLRALLAPFDSLIWMRQRTERLFDFHYRLAFYTPKAKRAHGYYVMPFLLGDRLVARVDLKSDRKRSRLQVLGGHAEPNADAHEILPALREELELMRGWLGLDSTEIKLRGDFLRALRRVNAPTNPGGSPRR